MRKSNVLLSIYGLLFCLMILTFIDVQIRPDMENTERQEMQQTVAELGLSDLSLFTEARYTRHLSLADRHAAFQDHPMAMEHFPSGSLVLPPRQVYR